MANKTHRPEQEQGEPASQIKDLKEEAENPIKAEFRKYLSERLKSASNYMSVLDRRVSEYIRRLVDPNADSIFYYTTSEDVEKCIMILEASDEFNMANERSHGLMHAALQQYLSFIYIDEMGNKDVARPNKLTDIVLSYEEANEAIAFAGEVVAYEMRRKKLKTSIPVKSDLGLISYLPKLFKKRASNDTIYSSVFSPAEVKRDSHFLVSVFLHSQDDAETVISMAKEADSFTTRRGYRPLPCKMREGDMVDIQLSIMGKTLLFSDNQAIIWRGVIASCSFDYPIPNELDEKELCCSAVIKVNGAPIGEMKFITKIVEQPTTRNTKVISQPWEKIFISYAHQDEKTVRHFSQAFKMLKRDVFFDRDYLKAGDIFSEEIEKYIKDADVFILFWSENAAKSEYVQKELALALPRAYPQTQPLEKAKLSIYPMSIEPRAELPDDMKNIYNFEVV